MELVVLEGRIGVAFKDKKLLGSAIIHPSYLNESKVRLPGHYQRLEFVGDAVLLLIVKEYLYKKYPEKDEGELTFTVSTLVRNDTLAGIATFLKLDEFLLMSRGERKNASARSRNYMLACCFEAVVGAVFLDQGYEVARKFVMRTSIPQLAEVIVSKNLYRDPKSLFQEEAQAREKLTPRYELLTEEGPDHSRRFLVAVLLGEMEVARASGASKKHAETRAAEAALKAKGWVAEQ